MPPDFRSNSNCFALNGNIFRPEVKSLENVILTYKKSLRKVRMNGPCMLSEIIYKSLDYCKFNPVSQNNQNYYVLLIMIHSDIEDLAATIEAILEA